MLKRNFSDFPNSRGMCGEEKKKKRAFTRKRNKTFFSVPDHFLKRQCFCSVARAYSWQSAALVLLGKARRERETKEQTATTKQAEVKWVKREKANVSLSFFFFLAQNSVPTVSEAKAGCKQMNNWKAQKREREQKTMKQHCGI